jgi:hypothetical protein
MYICAFVSFVLCPAVDHLYDTPGHDVVIKKETRLQQKEYDRGLDGNFVKDLVCFQTGLCKLPLVVKGPGAGPSSPASFNLSLLSGVRLNV